MTPDEFYASQDGRMQTWGDMTLADAVPVDEDDASANCKRTAPIKVHGSLVYAFHSSVPAVDRDAPTFAWLRHQGALGGETRLRADGIAEASILEQTEQRTERALSAHAVPVQDKSFVDVLIASHPMPSYSVAFWYGTAPTSTMSFIGLDLRNVSVKVQVI